MNKKTVALMLLIGVVVAFVFSVPLEIGTTPLRNTSYTLYNDGVYITTDAAADTSYTQWYSTDKIGAYNSLRIVVDSVRGACSLKVVLQESWDGESVEFQTTVFYQNIAISRLDSVVEINFYPAPYSRFLLYECDAAATESLQIDTLELYSHE